MNITKQNMKSLDYEIEPNDEGGFHVWTPDATGGIIGSGKTRDDALRDAVITLSATIAEITTAPTGSAHALAATIAAALFRSGDGKRASRLHFILESGDVWGGWSEAAVAAQIEKLLSAPNNTDHAQNCADIPADEQKPKQ